MILNSEIYGIDTNILVYASDKNSIFYSKSRKTIEEIAKGKIFGVITPQNILEYISVVTSKKRLSKSVEIDSAIKAIEGFIESGIDIVYPTKESTQLALKFAEKTGISGRKIFDFYLAATLIENDIKFLITANSSDFEKFGGPIRVINPFKS